MAKLTLSLDGMVIREYPLTKERTTIGRKPHNDIVIDNLAISGEHAMIMTILNDSFLEDLGSTNGTLVNGQPVKKHFLQGNDTIEIGKYKLKYVNETPASMSRADFEKTMVLRTPAASTTKPEARKLTDTQTNLEAPAKQGELTASTPSAVTVPADTTLPGIATGAKSDPAPVAAAPLTAAASTVPQGSGTIQILSGPNAGKE